jgi:MFS family permease
LVLIAGAVGASGFSAFVPLYAREIGLPGARFVFMTFSGILMLMRTLGARAPDRLGSRAAALAALAGTAAGLGVVGTWREPAGLFAGTVIFAFGHALLFPSLLMLAISRGTAHERAGVVGTLTSFLSLSFAAGPAAFGVIAGSAGYAGAFLVAAGVAAVGCVWFWRYPAGRLALVPAH